MRVAWWLLAGVALAAALAMPPAIGPYGLGRTTSFWEDVQTVHGALERARHTPQHGAARPYFESMTNMFSDAEKGAFDRIHSGMLPEAGLDVADDIPTKMPIALRMCDAAEEPLVAGSSMHVESLAVTLDLKHIKTKIDMDAELDMDVQNGLTHHTVVTVDGVSMGGFEMSPMVLYDLTGSVCELYDNVLGCPLSKGHLTYSKKVKVPGLDAIASLPRRLYNAQVKLYDARKALVSCMHLYLDLRPEEDKAAKPVPGVLQIGTAHTPSPSKSPSPSPAPATVAVVANVSTGPASMLPQAVSSALANLRYDPSTVASALSTRIYGTDANLPDGVPPPAPPALDSEAIKLPGIRGQDETAVLQQLQLKNLQEQLDKQMEINAEQEHKYEQLEKSLHGLDTSEIDQLKKTVAALMGAQKEESEHIIHQKQTVEKEQMLYSQLSQMYGSYNLPVAQLPVVAEAQPSQGGFPKGMFVDMPFGPMPGPQPAGPVPGLQPAQRAAVVTKQPEPPRQQPHLVAAQPVELDMRGDIVNDQEEQLAHLQELKGKQELLQTQAEVVTEVTTPPSAPAVQEPLFKDPNTKNADELLADAQSVLLSPMATVKKAYTAPSEAMWALKGETVAMFDKGMGKILEKANAAKDVAMQKALVAKQAAAEKASSVTNMVKSFVQPSASLAAVDIPAQALQPAAPVMQAVQPQVNVQMQMPTQMQVPMTMLQPAQMQGQPMTQEQIQQQLTQMPPQQVAALMQMMQVQAQQSQAAGQRLDTPIKPIAVQGTLRA